MVTSAGWTEHDHWQLRPATLDDVGGLHSLACMPMVYRYLFDGIAPDRAVIADRLAQAVANQWKDGLGMWVLQCPYARCAGCVELRPYPAPRTAEITYLLEPCYWGQGLGTRMAWTAITYAFGSSKIGAVVAGADLPNVASLSLMRRLGMRSYRNVKYPLGDGAEYVLRYDDAGPNPLPALIPRI